MIVFARSMKGAQLYVTRERRATWDDSKNVGVSRYVESSWGNLLQPFFGRNLQHYGQEFLSGGKRFVSQFRVKQLTGNHLARRSINLIAIGLG
jgi:hypothetical protein